MTILEAIFDRLRIGRGMVSLARLGPEVPEQSVRSTFRPTPAKGLRPCDPWGQDGMGAFAILEELEERGHHPHVTLAECIRARGRSVFVDVGPHVGFYSLPVSGVLGPGGRVFAFEPSDSSFRYLQRRIAYNAIENIYRYKVVVGETDEDSVPFYEHATHAR